MFFLKYNWIICDMHKKGCLCKARMVTKPNEGLLYA